MLTKDARRLARELTQRTDFENSPGPHDRAVDLTFEAIAGTAGVFILDEAVGTIGIRDDESLVLVATDGTALYAIEAIPPASDFTNAFARCRMIPLDASRDAVEHTTAFHRPHGTVVRETHWKFRVSDIEFSIGTRFDQDEERPDADLFAERLATAMGWNYGGSARAGLREAA